MLNEFELFLRVVFEQKHEVELGCQASFFKEELELLEIERVEIVNVLLQKGNQVLNETTDFFREELQCQIYKIPEIFSVSDFQQILKTAVLLLLV